MIITTHHSEEAPVARVITRNPLAMTPLYQMGRRSPLFGHIDGSNLNYVKIFRESFPGNFIENRGSFLEKDGYFSFGLFIKKSCQFLSIIAQKNV